MATWPAVGTGQWPRQAQFTVYRLRHSCPTARTAARPITEGMTIFCLVSFTTLGQYGRPCQQQLGFLFFFIFPRFLTFPVVFFILFFRTFLTSVILPVSVLGLCCIEYRHFHLQTILSDLQASSHLFIAAVRRAIRLR